MTATGTTRQLRVAMLWNGALMGERLLTEPRAVTLGAGKDALFPLPDGVDSADGICILEPSGAGYELKLNASAGGFVSIGGRRTGVRDLTQDLPIGPADYGVLTLGTVAFFFQMVVPTEGQPRRRLLDGALIACLGLSVFVHVASLLFLFLVAAQEFPQPSLELDSELVRKFLIIPPPEELQELNRRTTGTETNDPGLRDRDEAQGKRHEREEGRVGKKKAQQQDTEVAGDPNEEVNQKVRGMGLLGVLSGGGSHNAISNALDTPSLDQLLSGLGAVRTLVGEGSGGMGLRGEGSGGGGKGQGALFGAGALGTGVAGGKGSGRGKGKGGIGMQGRKAREVSLALGGSAARVNGYLSKEQINRVVRANQASIKYCFELALQRQPNLKGAVHVQWRINLKGRVSSARVAKTTLRNSRVEGCMARQIKKWKFPEPDGGEVVVTYPFLFRVG